MLGFTLVELIVVIVVLGVLAALLVPSFRAVTARTENQKAALELSAVLRQATALAALEGLDVNAAHLTAAVGDMSGSSPEASDGTPPGQGRGRGLRLLAEGESSTVYGDVSWGINQERRQVTVAMKSVPGMCVAARATTNAQGAALGVATAVLSDRIDCDAASDEVADGEFTEGMPSSPSGPIVLDPNVETIEGPGFACEYSIGAQIHCYGRNYYGQTGQPASSSTTTIVYIPGITVTEAAAGHTHVAAITTDRRVVIWGRIGGDAEATTPVPGSHTVRELTLPAGVTPVTVSAGRDMTAVVGSDRSVYVFGPTASSHGQGGSPTGFDRIQLPDTVTDITQVVAVECGANFLCVLLDDGTVWCAGYNDHGQLGDGSAIRIDAPADTFVQVTTAPAAPLTGALELTLGRHHAQVRTANLVHAWGKASAGAIGDGQTTTDRNRAVQVCDTDVAGGCAAGQLTSAARLFPAGPDHTCTILTDGTYACTGTYGDPEVTTDIYTVVAQLPYRYAPTFDAPTRPTPPAGGGGDGAGDGDTGGGGDAADGGLLGEVFGTDPPAQDTPAAPTELTLSVGTAAGTAVAAYVLPDEPITGRRVRCASPSGGAVRTPSPIGASPAGVGGLSHGHSYLCQVAAVNDAGIGAWSEPAAVTLPAASWQTGLLVADDFARAAGSDLGSTPVGERLWVPTTTSVSISNQRLLFNGRGPMAAHFDAGVRDFVFRADPNGTSLATVFHVGQTAPGVGGRTMSVAATCAEPSVQVAGDLVTTFCGTAEVTSTTLPATSGTFVGIGATASTSTTQSRSYNTVELAGLDEGRPAAVASFTAVPHGAEVQLRWVSLAPQTDHFELARAGTVIATLPATARSFTVAAPAAASVSYQLVAVDPWGNRSTARQLAVFPVTVPSGRLVAFDDFGRANSTALGETPVGQLPWRVYSQGVNANSTWSISNGRLARSTGNGALAATFDTGHSAGSLTFRRAAQSTYAVSALVVAGQQNGTGIRISPTCGVIHATNATSTSGTSLGTLAGIGNACTEGVVTLDGHTLTFTTSDGAVSNPVQVPASVTLGTHWGVWTTSGGGSSSSAVSYDYFGFSVVG